MEYPKVRRYAPTARRYPRGGRADVVTVTVVLAGLTIILTLCLTSYRDQRARAMRRLCSTRVGEIGKATVMYANDYDGILPITGGPETVWGPVVSDWKAQTRAEAFGLDANDTGGQATVSASFYLLIKHVEVSPESFCCPQDEGTTEFRLQDDGGSDRTLADLWDFGPDPARHCSYAYHLPYRSIPADNVE